MPLPPSLCVAYSVETETLPPSKTPVGVLPWTCRIEGNDRADKLTGKATVTCGLHLGSVEELETLRADTKPRTTPLTPSIAWRRKAAWIEEAARRSSFKGRKRAVVNQNIGTVLKVTMGKRQVLRRDRGAVERIMGFSGLLLRLPISDDLELPN